MSTDSRGSSGEQFTTRVAEREHRLREDSRCRVLGPETVECKLCKKEIRLSSKSQYDSFHWNKHIERCARLTLKERAARIDKASKAADKKKRSSMSKEIMQTALPEPKGALTIRLRTRRSASASTPAPSSLPGDSANSQCDGNKATPPRSNSSPTPDVPTTPPSEARPLSPSPDTSSFDEVMEEYYIRSRRRCRREMSPFTLESASAWSWKTIKEPVWVVQREPPSPTKSPLTLPDGGHREWVPDRPEDDRLVGVYMPRKPRHLR